MKQQNKTELQEALEWRNEISREDSLKIMGEFISKYNKHPEVVYREAAQAYADLPEKIEGMREPSRICDVDLFIDDILNLLKEEV